ncbi:hypothetical protein, no similarity [Maudiozyma saulgeensis]|uniref:C2H2-type domain-containing protein n=1 Tax=Maudiozyma saulgeensis TaxID=1789683 RepID=A0A1X7R873_9SACH|nr:hypothetical protein, no similarity [Kazachstania saulgeensis]
MTSQFDHLSYVFPTEPEYSTGFMEENSLDVSFRTTLALPYDNGAINFEPVNDDSDGLNVLENIFNTDTLFLQTNSSNNSIYSNNIVPEENNQFDINKEIEEAARIVDQECRLEETEEEAALSSTIASSSLSVQQQHNVAEENEVPTQYVSAADLIIKSVEDAIQQFDAKQAAQILEHEDEQQQPECSSEEHPTRSVYILNLVNNRGEKADAKQEKPVECPDCKRTCQSEAHLDRHADTVHSEERPWACPDCTKRFKRKDHLVKHGLRLHHWSITQIKGLKTPKEVLEKKRRRKEKRMALKKKLLSKTR